MPVITNTPALIVQAILLLAFTVWAIKAWRKDHVISITLGVINLFLLVAILGQLQISMFLILLTLATHHV